MAAGLAHREGRQLPHAVQDVPKGRRGDRRSGKGEERVRGRVGLNKGQMDAAWSRKRRAAGADVIHAVGAPLPFHTFHTDHTFPRISPTLFSP